MSSRKIEGWGESVDKVQVLIKDDPEVLEMFRREVVPKQGGDRKSEQAKIKSNNVTPDLKRGNSKAHSLSVLKRKAPDMFRAVCNGETTANEESVLTYSD